MLRPPVLGEVEDGGLVAVAEIKVAARHLQFVAQRLRPITRFTLNRDQGSPRRDPRTVLRDATRKVVRIATIDIDRDPWWIHFRRRR